MTLEQAAAILKELGHPTRLSIYRYLIKSGPDGLPVGALQTALSIPHSTLSHHLSCLCAVGIVTQTRQGRCLLCTPNFSQLETLLHYLTQECCQGVAVHALTHTSGDNDVT